MSAPAPNPLNPGYYNSDELRAFGFRSVGENVRLSKLCNIVGPENIEIGHDVRIDAFTSIIAATGYVRLGSYIHIGTSCLLGARGGIELGDFSGLSQGVSLFSATDDFSGDSMISYGVPEEFTNVIAAPIKMRRQTVAGAGTVVLPGVTFEEGAVTGALTFVRKSLLPWSIYFGVPAKRLRGRSMAVLELEREFLKQVAEPGAAE